MATRTLNRHDRQHVLAIQAYEQEVERLYEEAMDKVAQMVLLFPPEEDEVFELEDNPVLQAGIESTLDRLRADLEGSIRAASALEWERGLTKNLELAIMAYGPTAYPLVERTLAADNRAGLLRFLSRKTGPARQKLTLSQRVWRLRNGLQREIESELFASIQEGVQPAEMARNMRRFLKDPGRAHRRVRDAEGVLRLSKSARSYNPGRGVYRSSLQNAIRLTRHESNAALRVSEAEKWRNSPFVVGYRTVLSPMHPRFDICDLMTELTFPVEFHWEGWHIQCLCAAEPILASEREYREWERAGLQGKQYSFESKVTELPGRFTKYVSDHATQYRHWKTPPIFLQQNPKLRPLWRK